MLDKKSQIDLLTIPQVVGVGHGLKEVGGFQTEKEAVIVLVKEKLPLAKLSQDQLIPQTIKGLVTDVIAVGEFKAYVEEAPPKQTEAEQAKGQVVEEQAVVGQSVEEQLNVEQLEAGQAEEAFYELITDVDRTARLRPAMPGISIGHYLVTAGTFGAVVYDKSTGQPFILSNNHILANSSNGHDARARIGDPILQPGAYDGGKYSKNILARLAKYVTLDEYPLVNLMDCALAKPLNNDLIVPDILGIGVVQGVVTPALGMIVVKSGRTSDVTNGQIRVMNVTADVNYGQGRVLRFENQIFTTPMSQGGDSGSLVLDENNLAVGLLFAGSDQGTLINPIQPILELLNIKF